jgi:hypothetical protein
MRKGNDGKDIYLSLMNPTHYSILNRNLSELNLSLPTGKYTRIRQEQCEIDAKLT